jgi:DNA polymerase III subunit alpha
MQKIPLWTSHYSGRSILTLEKESPEIGPKSILDICKKNQINDVYLIESSMTGFLEAYSNCKDLDLNLRFGLKLIITDDSSVKEESLKNESKIILFIKNSKGYKDLIKVWAWAYENGFYYLPRIDWKNFNNLITDNLTVAFPFYDSFVAKNTMTFSEIMPSLSGRPHTFFVEDNDLPFDNLIKEALELYCSADHGCTLTPAQSIFYENSENFKAYQTFRCILNKSKLPKPELEYMSSDTFNFKRWKEENGSQN